MLPLRVGFDRVRRERFRLVEVWTGSLVSARNGVDDVASHAVRDIFPIVSL